MGVQRTHRLSFNTGSLPEEHVHRCVPNERDVIQEKLHHELTYILGLPQVYSPTSTRLPYRTETPSKHHGVMERIPMMWANVPSREYLSSIHSLSTYHCEFATVLALWRG
jgi:hypothetical protein